MKKILFPFILLLSVFSLNAQRNTNEDFNKICEILTQIVVQETDGMIKEFDSNSKYYSVDIKVSSMYNNEKIIAKLNQVFKNAKMETIFPWGQAGKDEIRCAQALGEFPVTFNYVNKTKILSFLVVKE